MSVKTLEQLPVDGRRVFLRLDLNVPLDAEGNITDDSRIRAAIPTLQQLIEREARLIIGTHLGRPKGVRKPEMSVDPVGVRLAQLLDGEVILSEESIGDGPRKMAFALREGQVMLLENLRFYPGEEANDDSFAKQLASLADMYINDAFGTMHRAHASIVGVPKYLKDKGIGLLAAREIAALSKLLSKPEKPYVAIIGGAKVRDKVNLLLNLVGQVDVLCIGGAMAVTFLAARGVRLGASHVEMESLALADKVMRKAAAYKVDLVLPVDHVAADKLEPGTDHVIAPTESFPDGKLAVDIGPRTIELFLSKLGPAATVFWNGPLGVFEISPFNAGTEAIGRGIAKGNSYSVVGGGDSVAALRRGGLIPFISHVSTGGGAVLKFLEGAPLPGIAALEEE